MPELPEVQTIVSDLNKKIVGDMIVDFWSDAPGAIKNATVEKFKKAIRNHEILGVHRLGKNIFIDLSGGKTIYIHLKMTGHLLVKSHKVPKVESEEKDYFSERVNQYIHHKWFLNSKIKNSKINRKSKIVNRKYDKTLEFSDLRKFAKIVLLETLKIKEYKDIAGLGIDAMDPKFNYKKFEEILSKKEKIPIGILLMDQSQIAGIGNIYRSEILFESGVLPTRKIADLSPQERQEIFSNIKKVLRVAIKYRGTSDSDYRDTEGAPGGFQKIMKVYNREKKKCPKCDTIIRRMKLGQRSVFYCPDCQK